MIKKINPATLTARGARVKLDCWAAPSVPENKAPAIDIQDRRALWLERRYRLAPALAATIAELVFAEARR
jgi:hypothetical protein